MEYYVAMIDYGKGPRRPMGLEAQVDPEITRRGVVERIVTGEWRNIAFIHHIHDGMVEDVTDELMEAALVAQLSDPPLTSQQHADKLLAEHQASRGRNA
jgi:hypothetical protein